MYGLTPSATTEKVDSPPPREQVEQLTMVLLFTKSAELVVVDARDRDVRQQPEDDQDPGDVEDPAPQVRRPERVEERVEHGLGVRVPVGGRCPPRRRRRRRRRPRRPRRPRRRAARRSASSSALGGGVGLGGRLGLIGDGFGLRGGFGSGGSATRSGSAMALGVSGRRRLGLAATASGSGRRFGPGLGLGDDRRAPERLRSWRATRAAPWPPSPARRRPRRPARSPAPRAAASGSR